VFLFSSEQFILSSAVQNINIKVIYENITIPLVSYQRETVADMKGRTQCTEEITWTGIGSQERRLEGAA
jgi:hypothetical protein